MLSDETAVLPWDYGRLFGLRMGSNYIRVTARGVQFSTMAALSTMRSVENLGWTANASCVPTPNALCREGRGLVFFPDNVVDVPYDFSQIPSNTITDYFENGSSCLRAQSMRSISITDTQYELSLCDLMDANMDILIDCTTDTMYWRQDKTTTAEYMFISLMCVYLMSCISANVVKLSSTDGFHITWLDIVVLLANILYLAVEFVVLELRFLVSTGDVTLAIVLWIYVCLETLAVLYFLVQRGDWQLACWTRGAAAPVAAQRSLPGRLYFMGGISVYTALLMLLTLRVHYTFDNPYLHILSVMFGSRTFLKVSGPLHLQAPDDAQSHGKSSNRVVVALLVVYDTFCFCVVLALGVGMSADHDFEAMQQQTMLVVVSMLLATAVSVHRLSQK